MLAVFKNVLTYVKRIYNCINSVTVLIHISVYMHIITTDTVYNLLVPT